MTTTTVVLGPRTRLGRAVVDRLRRTGERVLLVARHDADATALADLVDERVRVLLPGDAVADALEDDAGTPIRLVVAALGPVYPGEPDLAEEAAAAARDLARVREVLATGRPVQVILVSSVIALAPRDERRHYGGWKSVVEAELESAVAAYDRCTLTVLYPGRLVATRAGGPSRWLHTTYARLAGLVLAQDPSRPRSRVAGTDSRILLLVRSISIAVRSLTGSWGRT